MSRKDRDWYDVGRPSSKLIVEARDLATSAASKHSLEVIKPAGPGRQREQLVRAVTKLHPEAQLSSVADGVATFFSRTSMIVASYGDASAAAVDAEFESARAGVWSTL